MRVDRHPTRVAHIMGPVSKMRAVGPSVEDASMAADMFFQVAESANDVIIITTPDLEPPHPLIVYVNPAFTRLTGYSAAEAIGKSPRMLQGAETDRTTLDAVRTALSSGREVREKVLNFGKGGERYWLDLRIVPLRDSAGKITHFAAIERDVTMDKRRLEELELIADRDALTGIPNRRALLRVIESEIAAMRSLWIAKPTAREACLAFIDVDHFKNVNDVHGHGVGDAVLLGLADRLTENLRRSDMLGRMGGEEFALWMPGVTLQDAQDLVDRLRRVVADEPFDTPAGPLTVTVSVGVTAFQPIDNLVHLMDRADMAMYSAKQAGRNRVMALAELLENVTLRKKPPRRDHADMSYGDPSDIKL
jgi:diguanylate cyclase (GGDEF)-like protein/PAS domain S-box-containing protein